MKKVDTDTPTHLLHILASCHSITKIEGQFVGDELVCAFLFLFVSFRFGRFGWLPFPLFI